MVNERKDFIELGTLTMDELAGVVHLYPWFASARKELCRRMSRLGGDDWGEEQYAEEALYIGDRRKVAELVRSGRKADYADKDVEKILRSYIAPAPEADGEEERKVHVVGGDYFSQAQYKDVGRADDNIFTRFAVKVKSDGAKDERTGSDIADRYATETLAEIFAEQGCVEEARRIYSRLTAGCPPGRQFRLQCSLRRTEHRCPRVLVRKWGNPASGRWRDALRQFLRYYPEYCCRRKRILQCVLELQGARARGFKPCGELLGLLMWSVASRTSRF